MRLPGILLSVGIALALFSHPASADEALIDELGPDALQEAFRVLQEDYIRGDAFSYTKLNRAALDGLLEDLQTGARLVPVNREDDPDAPSVAFASTLLTPEIGYVRPASWQADEIPLIDNALKTFEERQAEFLILDLRVPQPQADLAAAAQLVSRFVEPDQLVFKVEYTDRKPTLFLSTNSDVRWEGQTIVLTDQETSNAGELVAAILQTESESLVAGQATAGLTVQYHEIPLNAETRLRYAAAEVLLGDETSLFQTGVQPDYPLPPALKAKQNVYARGEESPITNYIFEKARPRLSEADLVHGTDPELDYHLARSKGKETRWDNAPLVDPQLQRAVDLFTAQLHLQAESD